MDILTLLFALLALGLFVYKEWFRYRNIWKGHKLFLNDGKGLLITGSNKTTLFVLDFDGNIEAGSKYTIK